MGPGVVLTQRTRIGYTGRLITTYLHEHPERSSFTLGIAARSKAKLNDLKKSLKLDDSVETFYVDVTKPASVEEVVKQAKVVINTIGPFWYWGEPVVAACVRNGKLYLDTSGEVAWVQEMIVKYDYLASKTHAVIIPFCGFDSVPSDLIVYLANRDLKAFAGPETGLGHSTTAMKVEGGGLSGGSLATMRAIFEDVPAWKRKATHQDFALSTGIIGVSSPPPRLVYQLPFSDPPIYGGISIIAVNNRQIVQRTWGLHEIQRATKKTPLTDAEKIRSYGPQFKYEEFLVGPNIISSAIISIGVMLFALLLSFSPTRWLVKMVAPNPGEGPSTSKIHDGKMVMTNVTASIPTPSKPELHVRTTLTFKGEPGYFLTSVTISEGALALLHQRSELPPLAQGGGVLTPMSALGDVFVDRLQASGRFSFSSEILVGENKKSR